MKNNIIIENWVATLSFDPTGLITSNLYASWRQQQNAQQNARELINKISQINQKDDQNHNSAADFVHKANQMNDNIDLSYRDPTTGNTVLHETVNYNNVQAVRYLPRLKASQDIKNNDNQTPLELTTESLKTI
jgi:hypothetical protein